MKIILELCYLCLAVKQLGLAEQAVVFNGACTAEHPEQYFCLTAGSWPQEQICHGAYEEGAEQPHVQHITQPQATPE